MGNELASEADQCYIVNNASECPSSYQYYSNSVAVNEKQTSGNVQGSITDTLRMFATDNGSVTTAKFTGKIDVQGTSIEGAGFELFWPNPQAGDYFIVTVDTDDGEGLFMAIDGASLNPSNVWHRLSFNANYVFHFYFNFYFLPDSDNVHGALAIRNFEAVGVK